MIIYLVKLLFGTLETVQRLDTLCRLFPELATLFRIFVFKAMAPTKFRALAAALVVTVAVVKVVMNAIFSRIIGMVVRTTGPIVVVVLNLNRWNSRLRLVVALGSMAVVEVTLRLRLPDLALFPLTRPFESEAVVVSLAFMVAPLLVDVASFVQVVVMVAAAVIFSTLVDTTGTRVVVPGPTRCQGTSFVANITGFVFASTKRVGGTGLHKEKRPQKGELDHHAGELHCSSKRCCRKKEQRQG